MEHIKGILINLWSFPSWKLRLEAAEILDKWEEIVGPVIANVARPRAFSQGILTIEVEDSIWMNRLHFEEKRIISLLNERCGKELFAQIRWVLNFKHLKRRPDRSYSIQELPESLKQKIEQEVEVIKDRELRNAFFALRLTIAKKGRRAARHQRYKDRQDIGR